MEQDIKCVRLEVGDDVCYLGFDFDVTRGRSVRTKDIGRTVRGEMVLVDFNANGEILGIELVGGLKPCQKI